MITDRRFQLNWTHFIRGRLKNYEKEVADLYLKGSSSGTFGRSFLIKCFEDVRDASYLYRNNSYIKRLKFKECYICHFMKRFNLEVSGLSKRVSEKTISPENKIRLSEVSDGIKIEKIGISLQAIFE